MRRAALVFQVSLFASIFVCGCVEKEPERNEKVDDDFVKQNLLSAAPTPKLVVNADLGGKVTYLGADIDKETVAPGGTVKITHYWKVVAAPGPEWRIFTHVNGAVAKDWMNVDETKLRKNYGPDKWKAGDIIKDEQTIPLKKDWSSSEATIYVGMYKKGGHSEADRMAVVSGPADAHKRVVAAKLTVSGAAAGKPGADKQAGYVIRKASGPITIDGKSDEPDWGKAMSTGNFKDAEGGTPVEATMARLLWDDKNLYVFVDIADKDVASQFTKHDDSIWKEDAVELFIDADKNGHGYVELQVNPRNTTFDSWFQTVRPNGDTAWDSKMQTAVVVDGTLDKRDDTDKGWRAELAIPLEAVKGKDAAMAIQLPPKPGDTWKLNVVRVEKPKDKQLTASAWAQISIQDFHAMDRLQVVTFGDADGKTASAPPPAQSTPGPTSKPAASTATPAPPAAKVAPHASPLPRDKLIPAKPSDK